MQEQQARLALTSISGISLIEHTSDNGHSSSDNSLGLYEGGDNNNFDYEEFEDLFTDRILFTDNPLLDDAFNWTVEPDSNTNTVNEHTTATETAANTHNTTIRKKKYTKRAPTPHSKKVTPYAPLYFFKTLANPDHED